MKPPYQVLQGLLSQVQEMELRYIIPKEQEQIINWLDNLLTEEALTLPYQK